MRSKKNDSSEETLHGTARFANEQDIRSARLCSDRGFYHGLLALNGPAIRLTEPQHALIFVGPGGGALRDTVMEQVLTCSCPLYVADPRRRIGPVTLAAQALLGKPAYCFTDGDDELNCPPWFLHGTALNPLSILTPGHPALSRLIGRIIQCLIDPPNESRSTQQAEYVTIARRWLSTVTHWRISSRNRVTSLPDLHALARLMGARPKEWYQVLEQQFFNSEVLAFRRFAEEMRFTRAHQAEKYCRVIAILQEALEPLGDARLTQKLGENGLSIQTIIDAGGTLYNLSRHRALQRVIWMSALLHRQANPGKAPMAFIIDQRGWLGVLPIESSDYIDSSDHAIAIEEIWKSVTDMKVVLGDAEANRKLALARIQQFYNVNAQDAAYLSPLLGTTTKKYRSSRTQMLDNQRRAEIALAVLNERDPLTEIVKANAQKGTFDLQARPLRRPEEIKGMNLHEQLLLAKGGCPPIWGARRAYYDNPALRGMYLPALQYPPFNQVRIALPGGRRARCRLIIENVPPNLLHLPQYRAGVRTVVEPSPQSMAIHKFFDFMFKKDGRNRP